MNQVYVGNTLPKQKHKSVNMFSNSNISKETFDKKKIQDQPSKSNDNIRIRVAAVLDVSQNAICKMLSFQ